MRRKNIPRCPIEKLSGLRVSLCQMPVVPGRPDLNARFIIEEIDRAKERGINIIIFPEMCTTGYIVGDVFEDDFFIEDVLRYNRAIVEATRNGVAAIFGTVIVSSKKGEDGRQRKHNAAVVAKDGSVLAEIPKTLQPNYRFFNDDKHFYSSRKIAEERNLRVRHVLKPVSIETRKGKTLVGVMLCEDMWHNNYPANPARILTDQGAEVLINISASPWTWQKNRKRHEVVQHLLSECRVPFVYVNCMGAQNTGKNIIVFDGSSAVYNEKGELIFEVPPYAAGSHDFTFSEDQKPPEEKLSNDTEELYRAMMCATKSAVPLDKKVLVGVSGGVDSATVLAHLVDVLGSENVAALNMPMPVFSSEKTQDMARRIAQNLSVSYEVVPIGDLVESISRATGVEPDTLAYENIQARARKEILAAKAQKMNGVFVCCSNKTEVALGYGTLYGDIAGFYAPLGDLVKREVRQIAEYLNQVRFKKEVIPQECIVQTPTAELARDQRDPFDYGDSGRRGYHDEMIRAFTEFRRNPEWFLELYLKGRLEEELKLDPGTLQRVFPTAKDFVNDLRQWWTKFQRSFFKRVQCPPIPIFSKRAFGRDLEESLMLPYFTQRYLYLENYLLSRSASGKRTIAIYGGSMNPPGMHHRLIIERLAKMFDAVLVVPCGIRADKPSTVVALPAQRKAMTLLAFQNMPNVEPDCYDLDNDVFTPTHLLEERYKERFPDAELWFAVGSDLVAGGREENSEIQRTWKRGKDIWQSLNFVVITQPGAPVDSADLPPSARILDIEIILGRSTAIRERVEHWESIENLVTPEVADYIQKEGLYRKT